MIQHALDIYPLADRFAFLEGKAVLPQLCLPGQDERDRTDRIKLHIHQEPYLLEHLKAQEMAFVHNTDSIDAVNCLHDGELLMELALGF